MAQGPTKSIFDIFILKQVINYVKFHKLQFLNAHKL